MGKRHHVSCHRIGNLSVPNIFTIYRPEKRIESRQKPIAAIRIMLSFFMVGLYAFIMAKSMGSELEIGIYVNIAVGF